MRAQETHGYSLLEMIIAMGIFVILTLAVLGIFSSSLRTQQTVLSQTKLEREAQLVLETMTKKIRASRVNYSAYPLSTVTNPETTLHLVDQTDTQVSFGINDQALEFTNNGVTLPITREDVMITSVLFFIEPTTDPFGGGIAPAIQPRVTVVITFESQDGRIQNQVILQQTVPQRLGAY